MAVMTSTKFVEKVVDIAKNYKTLYVMGCFGAPLNGSNVTRYQNNHSYNKQAERKSLIKSVANKNYFGFDCVCLIKGVLWGWNGDLSKTYGGATYASNNVPDIGADGMINKCSGVSTDFSKIEVGEAVWMSGHIGVYIGDGLAVECTPRWTSDVQITAVGNIGKKSGYNTRTWTKHGKLPYISYDSKAATKPETTKTETSKPASTTKKNTYTGTFPTLPEIGYITKGDDGTQVRNLQKFLNWYGSYGLTVDGDFGAKTETAVKEFQRECGLTVDGDFGAKSLAKAKTVTKKGTTNKTATTKAYTGTFPTLPTIGYLQKGDDGTQVKNLQKFLNWCIAAGLTVDGDFGSKTDKAVRDFQEKYGLTVDGLFGKKSLEKAKTIKK